jgi:zinc transport system ATP-binding protein
MMEQRDVITLEDVYASYNGVSVLEGVSLHITERDFLGIIGPNGGGKTTLLKVILGLVKPDRGQVLVLHTPPEKTRSRIGYIPQHNLFDREFPVSVWQAVLMGRNGTTGLFRRYSAADKEAAAHALEAVGMLAHRKRQVGKLSGGEQQRVFIARALVNEPAILLLDEPTASVDSAMQTEFYEMLESLKQSMTIVLVSHDMTAVSVFVDKIACLNCQLFYHGSPEIEAEVLEATYKCPVQMIAHGTTPHRVLRQH